MGEFLLLVLVLVFFSLSVGGAWSAAWMTGQVRDNGTRFFYVVITVLWFCILFAWSMVLGASIAALAAA